MTKSEAALHVNIARMFEHGTPVLVTLTFAEVLSVKQAFYQWRLFQNTITAFGYDGMKNTIYGLRVAELHDQEASGHGLHFHVVINRFVPIEIVRSIAERYGFYWLQMKECHTAAGLAVYLAKYLTKQDRPTCLKGSRLWAAFGKWGHSKVKNMRCLSEFSAAYRAAACLLATRERAVIHGTTGVLEPTPRYMRLKGELKQIDLLTPWDKHQICVEHAVSHLAAVLRGTRDPLTDNFRAFCRHDVGWRDEHQQMEIKY